MNPAPLKKLAARVAARHMRRTAGEGLVLDVNLRMGTATVQGQGSVQDLTLALNRQLINRVPGTFGERSLPGGRGKVKAFSFHWSNAQGAWDVIAVREPWSADGAEFMLYAPPTALSPLGKPWSLKEMEYVAAKLQPHSGYSFAVR